MVQTHTKAVWKVCWLLATWHTVVLKICITQNISHYFTSLFLKGGIFKNARITLSWNVFLIFKKFILHSLLPTDISFVTLQTGELMLCTYHITEDSPTVTLTVWPHRTRDVIKSLYTVNFCVPPSMSAAKTETHALSSLKNTLETNAGFSYST